MKEITHAALQLDLVGDHVGGDHRLAVAGAGGMEDAVGEGKADQRTRAARDPPHGLQRARQRAVEVLLLVH